MIAEADAPKKVERIYSVEFWRFAFTVLVALYHLEIYYMKKIMPTGSTAVEFFFILAGFTMAMSANRRMERLQVREISAKEAHSLAIDFVKKKLVSIFPVLAVTLVLAIVIVPVVFPAQNMFQFPGSPKPAAGWELLLERIKVLFSSEWEWLFMVGTPMGINVGFSGMPQAPLVPLWFLTHLLVVGYLYTFLLHRKHDVMMFAAPLVAILGLIFFTLNSFNILDFYVKMGPFNAGTVHAFSEMAMGISIYQAYAYLKKRKWRLRGIILLQLVELFAIYRYCVLTFGSNIMLGMDNFRRIPYILVIVTLSFLNLTFLSRLLNRKFMQQLGKISLTMYLIHFPISSIYMNMLSSLKMWTFMNPNNGWSSFISWALERSGGTDSKFNPIGISLADIIIYLGMTILAALLVNFIASLLVKLVRKLREKPEEAAV